MSSDLDRLVAMEEDLHECVKSLAKVAHDMEDYRLQEVYADWDDDLDEEEPRTDDENRDIIMELFDLVQENFKECKSIWVNRERLEHRAERMFEIICMFKGMNQ